jgi:hypothetical protein
MRKCVGVAVLSLTATGAFGQYASSGILKTDPSLVAWATGCSSLERGYVNIADPSKGYASYGTAANALGAAGSTVVSLGDGGSITLTFGAPIYDGEGADFAVFENGFLSGGLVYAELAFVEVSSNGTDFYRFPSVSLTQTSTQCGGFGTTDPTKVHNLAGQFVAGQGTPFDLSDLSGVDGLDLGNIVAVRIVDVVGSIDPAYATYDSLGNIVNDPWPTAFASGGFDLDAVGVIHAVPEPGALLALGLGMASILAKRRRRRCD